MVLAATKLLIGLLAGPVRFGHNWPATALKQARRLDRALARWARIHSAQS
jgi:hypothetical protein